MAGMSAPPRISVLLPVWNGAAYLGDALTGILAQTFADFELIVVDDGSTDETPAIIAACRDPRVRAFRRPHGGLVAGLMFGLEQARAEWVARQDADDQSHPDRLAEQWRSVQHHPDAVLSHTATAPVGGGTGPIGWFPRTQALLALKLCCHNPITHSAVMFRRAAALAAGGYRAAEFPAEDYALWGRLLEVGRIVGVPRPLVHYRVHAASVSRTHAPAQRDQTERLARDHCARFLRLPATAAERARRVLTPGPVAVKEWGWFWRHCAPRLRWRSAEAYAWLGAQTWRGIKA